MTRERFEAIKAAAAEMLDEVEWADFPAPTFDGGAEPVAREAIGGLLGSGRFQSVARSLLDMTFSYLEDERVYERMPCVQEVDLEAAGLVQSVMKKAIATLIPDLAEDLKAMPLRTKFRRMVGSVMQAPPDARVPSMATQRRLRALGLPAFQRDATGGQ